MKKLGLIVMSVIGTTVAYEFLKKKGYLMTNDDRIQKTIDGNIREAKNETKGIIDLGKYKARKAGNSILDKAEDVIETGREKISDAQEKVDDVIKETLEQYDDES
ncbi:hypothetical protein [Erysipelothrix anatis]|uniref:hypothetical protein n=1 Tax=Erysipelothrix anatis TaxID=2683713 RepID=UPI00135BA854|nr:hypothetical protein [Erysipelothrix anatis]